MLIFGPYNAIPRDEDLVIYNFNSLNQSIPLMPGLLVSFNGPVNDELEFDRWYRDYILQTPQACSSMMTIMKSLYDGHDVYLCTSEFESNPYASLLIESFIRILEDRYGVKYAIINSIEDFYYLDRDGANFSLEGIRTLNADINRMEALIEVDNIKHGGGKVGNI